MRPVRMTYEGAMHHVMCRGKEGIKILFGNRNKLNFLELLKECTTRYRVRLFGYCLLDNEYHLVIENSSGRMGDCLKQLNGQYGMYFRKSIGHKGPVFRDRYKSILVQDGSYLKLALGYVLLLPVREKIVEKAD
ncbi:MAG: hypothetical protein GY950_04035, partial [bacterium]|nr:hypothetical protein [bacterium]